MPMILVMQSVNQVADESQESRTRREGAGASCSCSPPLASFLSCSLATLAPADVAPAAAAAAAAAAASSLRRRECGSRSRRRRLSLSPLACSRSLAPQCASVSARNRSSPPLLMHCKCRPSGRRWTDGGHLSPACVLGSVCVFLLIASSSADSNVGESPAACLALLSRVPRASSCLLSRLDSTRLVSSVCSYSYFPPCASQPYPWNNSWVNENCCRCVSACVFGETE